ncbi:MAG: DMT family transporter [Bryobacteraceae bacterium]
MRISPSLRAAPAGALAIVVWASAYPAIRVGLRAYPPGELAALRYLVASAVFTVYFACRRQALPRGRDLFLVFLAGAVGIAAYNLLLNTGELTATAGAASLIINCMPVFAALLSVLFLGERLRPAGWIGIATSFCGVAVIALGGSQGMQFSLGGLFILLAALCGALLGFIQKPLLARHRSTTITACIMWSGALLLSPFLPAALRIAAHGPPGPTLAAIYLGLFPAAVGYLMWALVLSRLTLSETASMLYLIPIVAVAISFFWIGEIPAPSSIWGGGLAIAGVVLLMQYGKRIGAGSKDSEARVESRGS